MQLKEIAAISGKPGLYRVLKTTRNGVVVEQIGGTAKFAATSNQKISVLQEISIYTNTADGTVLLGEVFHRIHEKHGLKLSIEKTPEALAAMLADVLPEYDRNKVYPSDMKKLISWYELLAAHAPSALVKKAEEPKTEEALVEEVKTTDTVSTESAKKTSSKKKKESVTEEKANIEVKKEEAPPKKVSKKKS